MSKMSKLPDSPTKMDSIKKIVPCRSQQIETLLTIFGNGMSLVTPSLFLYGHSGTGKTMTVNTIMKTFELTHVRVNCVECYTPRLLFEQILNHLSGCIPSYENDFTPYARCDSVNDFVRSLKLLMQKEMDSKAVYIILSQSERLRDMNINILPAFLRLQELTKEKVCVILESEIVWEKFRAGTGVVEPIVIPFPDYSKDELLDIMALDCPEDYSMGFYRNYANLLMSVFHLACNNLNELQHLAMMNFPKYIQPIKNGEATVDDMSKLWRNIEPHLKKALQTVYLREVSSAQWEKMQQEADEASNNTPTPGIRASVELPYYSKYLLIAAYLASYNPAKVDRRFFAKNSGKITKRAHLASMKRQERTSAQLLGPKPFPMDRLMAIFYSIAEGHVALTANIYSQISSLVSLGLLSQAASSDHLDAPKYKCLVSLDFVKSISRTVNFEVLRYLYDFV